MNFGPVFLPAPCFTGMPVSDKIAEYKTNSSVHSEDLERWLSGRKAPVC